MVSGSAVRADTGRVLTELYRAHSAEAFRYALHLTGKRADAEDVVQHVFLQAHRHLETGRVLVSPRAWLLTAVKHRAYNLARDRRELPVDQSDLPARQHEASRDEAAELAEVRGMLWTLPEAQHQAFVLRHWSGLSQNEIAAVLDTTPSAVESLLVRARSALLRSHESASETCSRVRSRLLEAAALGTSDETHIGSCRECRHAHARLARAANLAGSLALVPGAHVADSLAHLVPGFSAHAADDRRGRRDHGWPGRARAPVQAGRPSRGARRRCRRPARSRSPPRRRWQRSPPPPSSARLRLPGTRSRVSSRTTPPRRLRMPLATMAASRRHPSRRRAGPPTGRAPALPPPDRATAVAPRTTAGTPAPARARASRTAAGRRQAAGSRRERQGRRQAGRRGRERERRRQAGRPGRQRERRQAGRSGRQRERRRQTGRPAAGTANAAAASPRWLIPRRRDVMGGENRAAQGRREGQYRVILTRPRTPRCGRSQPQPPTGRQPSQTDVQARGAVEALI